MSQKDKQKRPFGTFDLVATIALGSAVLVICITISNEILQDDRPDRAKIGAEALVHQMMVGGFGLAMTDARVESRVEPVEQALPAPSRRPASVSAPGNDGAPTFSLSEGVMGKDPWGRPYKYKLLRSMDGQPVRILVWSEGANQTSDTEFSEFEVALPAPTHKIRFGGDDIGFAYQKP